MSACSRGSPRGRSSPRSDRVELVVVATAQTTVKPRNAFDRVSICSSNNVVSLLHRIALGESHGAERQKSIGHDAARIDGRALWRSEQVASDLFANEVIKPQVRIEGVDDIIPITPRISEWMVLVYSQWNRRSGRHPASDGPSAPRSAGRRAVPRPFAERAGLRVSGQTAHLLEIRGKPCRSNLARRSSVSGGA